MTPVFQGVSDIILNKSNSYSGLPPFVKVLQGLRNDGHDVEFIVFTSESLIDDKIVSGENVTAVDWSPAELKRNPLRLLQIYRVIRQKIKQGNFDFVYGHGTLGVLASIAANKLKVPNGQRLYGVYPLYKEVLTGKGKWDVLLKKPLYFLSLYLKKSFMLVTNDGTEGDKVYKLLGPKKKCYDFYCWTNGVDSLPIKHDLDNLDVHKSLFYPGRIDEQKRQIYVLEMIEDIKAHIPDIKVYFGGSDQFQYAKQVKEIIRTKKLQDNAIILGDLKRDEMGYFFRNSLATLLLYDISNKGNTSLEALKSGAVIITEENTGLDELIIPGETGYFIKDANDIVSVLKKIKESPELYQEMKKKVVEVSDLKLTNWDIRVQKELELIYTAVRARGKK